MGTENARFGFQDYNFPSPNLGAMQYEEDIDEDNEDTPVQFQGDGGRTFDSLDIYKLNNPL